MTSMSECYFCGKDASSKYDYEQQLYKITGKTLNRIMYNQLSLTLPQCKACGISKNAQMKLAFLGAAPGVLWLLFNLFTTDWITNPNDSFYYSLGLLLVGGLLGSGLSLLLYPNLRNQKSVELHPKITLLLQEAWQLGEKPT